VLGPVIVYKVRFQLQIMW